MSNLTVIKTKDDLSSLVKDKNALARLKDDKVEEFKTNFIELWNNQYLIKNAIPSELLELCIRATNAGVSINPFHDESYILPFNQKGKTSKKLELVYRKEAIENFSYSVCMQIEHDTIWKSDNGGQLFSNLSYLEKSQIKMNDPSFIKENFLGFEIRYYDLNNMLKPQYYTITYDYLLHVSNDDKIKDDSEQIAKLTHKAYRKSFKMAFIPKSSQLKETLNRIDDLNNQDEEIETVPTENKKPLTELKINNEVVNYTSDDITKLWKNHKDKHSLLLPLIPTGWADSGQENINKIYMEFKEICL